MMNKVIHYFYPKKEICYFDNLKTNAFIVFGIIGFVLVLILEIQNILYPTANSIESFIFWLIVLVYIVVHLFILKTYGIKIAGNSFSVGIVIIIALLLNILKQDVSVILKYTQTFYTSLSIITIGGLFASRKIVIVNAFIILVSVTRVYIFAIKQLPEQISMLQSGYINYTVALINITIFIYFAQKFTDKALKQTNKEKAIIKQKNYELITSEEEIRATNEELMTTTDALQESNNELTDALEEIANSKTRYKLLSDLAFEGIFTHKNGIAINANKAFLKMIGYTEDKVIGKNIINMFVPKQYHAILAKSMTEDYAGPYQISGIAKHGTIVPMEFESRIIDKKNSVRVVAIRNITERKKHERELIIAKEKAEESDRLKAEFLNNMSHEVRTPMNGILGFSQLLNIPNLTPETIESYSKIILNSSNQLLSIIDNIIEISKLGTKQVKVFESEVNINSMLTELFSIFEIKAKENKIDLHVKNELPVEQSIIITDEVKVYTIISNLLENAFKFTSKGNVKFGYSIVEISKSKYIQFFVKDTGIGIENDKQNLVFNKFSQAESELTRKFGGLGLGLSIVKENTILLDGIISLKSEIGKGSTFFVSIPFKPVI